MSASRRGRQGRSMIEMRMPSLDGRSLGVAIALGVVVAALLLIAGLDVAVSWDRIHQGVTVGGIDVGGMSASDARALVVKEVEPRLKTPVTVTHAARRWTVSAVRTGAHLDPDAAIDAAWNVGREPALLANLGSRLGAWFGRRAIPLRATPDAAKLKSLTAEIAHSVFEPARDAGLVLEGTTVSRVSATAGTRARTSLLADDLMAAFVSQQRTVALRVEALPPRIADKDADAALAAAQRMVSAEATVTYETKDWRFTPDRIAGWVSFAAVPYAEATASLSATLAATMPATVSAEETDAPVVRHVLRAYVSDKALGKTLTPLVGVLGTKPVDATFRISKGKVSVVPGHVGTGVDMGVVADDLTRVLTGTGPRQVDIHLTTTQPKLTTEVAQGMGIKERISQFSTDYDPGNAPRVTNIHTLAKALDGKLVPPGGTFSFNGAVGERTAEKGYQEAPAIVKGKLVPQLGGGICQIGTTFFNTVFFSGLPVVERTNHSFYISHYPKGRDATVSWGGPDFRWKNTTTSWILVKTAYDSSSVTISLYGTDPGYKVTYTTGPFTNVVPYTTIKENDPTLLVGKTQVVDAGVDGRRVVVIRTVTLNGVLVSEDTFTSFYKPKNATVKVGTMQPSKPTTTTPTPTPQG